MAAAATMMVSFTHTTPQVRQVESRSVLALPALMAVTPRVERLPLRSNVPS
jgi:hypothetical protein